MEDRAVDPFDRRGMQNSLNRIFPGEYPPVPEGGAIWAFTVK